MIAPGIDRCTGPRIVTRPARSLVRTARCYRVRLLQALTGARAHVSSDAFHGAKTKSPSSPLSLLPGLMLRTATAYRRNVGSMPTGVSLR
eukprot:scaffold7957_cov37-Tisochrysis_lutea.AAC.1